MRGTRPVLILAAVTLVAVGAVTFVERGSGTVEWHVDELVFPAFAGAGEHGGAGPGDGARGRVLAEA